MHITRGAINTVWFILFGVFIVPIRIKICELYDIVKYQLYSFSDSAYQLNVVVCACKIITVQDKNEWEDLNIFIYGGTWVA